MRPEDVFAALAPGVPEWLGSAGRGGKARLTRAEASAYCQGMPRKWYLAARLKYSLDMSVVGALDYLVWDAGVVLAVKHKWRVPRGEQFLRRMGWLVLFELLAPERFRSESAWQLRAAFLGVSKSRWFACWAQRYEEVFREVDEWVNRAYRWVGQKLRMEAEPVDNSEKEFAKAGLKS